MADTPKPPLVEQPTTRPTNKLMSGILVGMLTNIALKLIDHYGVAELIGTDVGLLREVVADVISAIVGFGYAYFFTKDRGNQITEVKALERAVIQAGATLPPKPEGNTP